MVFLNKMEKSQTSHLKVLNLFLTLKLANLSLIIWHMLLGICKEQLRERVFHGDWMKLLLDMNLPPRWVQFLSGHGLECAHWSDLGKCTAKDSIIMTYAREHGYVVFTHDLDFGALLAATRACGPSVIQIRTQNVVPEAIGALVLNAITQFEEELRQGALITIDPYRSRARILPFLP